MEKIKRFVRNHESLMYALAVIYRFCGLNRIKGKPGLKISWGGVFAFRSTIFNYGKNNVVEIGKGCRLKHCSIKLYGDNNHVFIDRDCVANSLDAWISGGGQLSIQHNTHFSGSIHIACIEGRTVNVGERCLFSNDIVLRTGDSHSVLSLDGMRINPAADVYLGNHVWVGQRVIILKGSHIGDESILGTGAVVTGKKFKNNVIIAGNPARVIKENVTWHHELL